MDVWHFTEMPYPHLPPVDTLSTMRVRSRTVVRAGVRTGASPPDRRLPGPADLMSRISCDECSRADVLRAVAGREAGDDRLERPLAGHIEVRVAVLEAEQLAAVLEHEA